MAEAGTRRKAHGFADGEQNEDENEEERREESKSPALYIYTIGMKSALMGSRVQRWGRDYIERSA